MSLETGQVRQNLFAQDENLRQLAARHHALEDQLSRLQQQRFLTSEEEAEEHRLKKLKLQLKDEMEQHLRHLRMSPSSAAMHMA